MEVYNATYKKIREIKASKTQKEAGEAFKYQLGYLRCCIELKGIKREGYDFCVRMLNDAYQERIKKIQEQENERVKTKKRFEQSLAIARK